VQWICRRTHLQLTARSNKRKKEKIIKKKENKKDPPEAMKMNEGKICHSEKHLRQILLSRFASRKFCFRLLGQLRKKMVQLWSVWNS